MKINDILEDIEKNCSKITSFCATHMLEKNYDIKNDNLDDTQLKEIFGNYVKYNLYLNDYAGVIYNQYDSSIDNVYNELCEYYNIEKDNIYLYEFRLKKLQKNSPSRIMSIEDEDMKNLAISRIQEKLQEIYSSKYYKNNKDIVDNDLENIEKNISLLKQITN